MKRISPIPRDDNEEVIVYEEVERAIKQLKEHKRPGEDEVTGEMIKAGGENLTKEIHRLCAQVWKEGKVPEEWTKSVLVPKKGNKRECSNSWIAEG